MDEDTRPSATGQGRALYYIMPRRAELRHVHLPILAQDGDGSKAKALITTLYSALSRGTERLVFEGRLPVSEWSRMRAPHQQGDFPFPVKYGYAAVGLVEAGPTALIGRPAFAFYPHQDRFVIDAEALTPLPDSVPPRRAVLAANMETALNALWDGGVTAGSRVLVIGAGVVGCLIAALAASMPGAEVTLVDIVEARAAIAEALGAAFALPDAAPGDADIVFHTSASTEGLHLALACAGFEGRVVEVSWYGDSTVALPLGGAFHSRRLTVISSQVGAVAPAQRPRWPRRRRLAAAMSLLADPRYDALITEEVAFEDLPALLPRLLAPGAAGLATVVRYGPG